MSPRKLFLMGISAVYCAAFTSYYFQIRGLYGPAGILPVDQYLTCKDHDITTCFTKKPTLIWLSSSFGLNHHHMMEFLALIGTLLSSVGLVSGSFLTMPVMAILWLLYQSLYQAGQTFFWFQWDLLLLEAGFLAIFVSPLSRHASKEGSGIAMWLVKWLMFRLMFASGVVKLSSGCPLWWSLTALNVHYESQCLPTPPAWLHHQFPEWFQKLSVVATYVIEIGLPFLFFGPTRRLRLIAFYGQILLMGMIMLTGNYNFFNLLTCVLALSLLDDDWLVGQKTPDGGLRRMMSGIVTSAVLYFIVFEIVTLFGIEITPDWTVESQIAFTYSDFMAWVSTATKFSILLGASSLAWTTGRELWQVRSSPFMSVKVAGTAVVAVLFFMLSLVPYTQIDDKTHNSLWPELQDLSGKFSDLHVFGSYGLFRSMTGAEGRPELILEGANRLEGPWQELEFKYKPGNVAVGPKFCSPHQPRLDWQMWFAALGNYHRNPWLLSLAFRILTGEEDVYKLLDIERGSDFSASRPPKYIKGSLYTYRFTSWNSSTSDWWHRKFDSDYLPVFTADHQPLIDYLHKIKVLGSPVEIPQSEFLVPILDSAWDIVTQTEPETFIWTWFGCLFFLKTFL